MSGEGISVGRDLDDGVDGSGLTERSLKHCLSLKGDDVAGFGNMAKVDGDRQTVIRCHIEVELEEIRESEMS